MTESLPSAVMVVADAGPLIHLDELDSMGLLTDFYAVYVTSTVWREVEFHRPHALASLEGKVLRCSPVANERVDALKALYTLHAGEYEALCQCLVVPEALLLTDDTAARLAAKSLDVAAHGTIGLLLRAIRRRQLSKAQVVDVLKQIPARSSLHIRPALLAEIIQQTAAATDHWAS